MSKALPMIGQDSDVIGLSNGSGELGIIKKASVKKGVVNLTANQTDTSFYKRIPDDHSDMPIV